MGLSGILERHYKVLITFLALVLAVGYVHKLCWPHKEGDKFEYGYYAYESWNEGKMRWTWRRGRTLIKATSDLFGFKVAAAGYNSTGSEGLEFKLFLDGEMMDKVHFFDGGSRCLYYYVPNVEGKEVEIGTEVDKTFNLLRMKISEDGRELGVAVSPVSFLKIMPRDGVGFYKWEIWREGEGKGRGQRTEEGKRFRWTGKRASVSIADWGMRNAEKGERWEIFLKCKHPDVVDEAVVVRISDERGLLRTVIFERMEWRKVVLGGDELKDSKVVTFEVSRTWNPKRMGVSGDNRDLGVALATDTHGQTQTSRD